MSLVKSGVTWFRHSFSWSNTQASWRERLIGLAFLLVAAALIWYSVYRPVWESAVAWGVYFIALAVCSRQGWMRLFGPVLFYDMLVTARRSRYVIMRLMYALLLLFILSFLFLQLNQRNEDPTTILLSIVGFSVLVVSQVVLAALLTVLTSRIGRSIVVGLLILTLVLFVIGVVVLDFGNRNLNPNDRVNVRETAQLAEVFFFVFMLVQMTMVVLLTPAYVAGAISEEKDRKTIEFLLATDLTNREIILSKLLSRLANLTLFFLTGLPILSILQFIGGVDPQLMVASFVGTGLTMLGIASLSILLSTQFKRPRDSIGMTYLFLITYMSIATTGMAMSQARTGLMELPIWFNDDYEIFGMPLWSGPAHPNLADASNVLNAGNPIAAGIDITTAIFERTIAGGRTTLAAELPRIVTRFAWFHIPVSLVCILWSIARIRAIALTQTVGGKTAKASGWHRYRPPVSELPMLWKELHIEGSMRLNWLAFIVVVLLVLLTFGSGVLVLGAHTLVVSLDPWDVRFAFDINWHSLRENMNIWFRFAGTGVAGLMILHIAVRASTSISTERERDTFDALITTPMSSESILAAKLLGSMTSLRLAWLWCGAMLALAIFSGGLHLLAVPLIVFAWIVYALLFAMIGTWFSMVAKTSLRATVYTVMATIAVSVGHWLITGMCCFPIFAVMRVDHPGDFPEYLAKFQAGMTPPFVFGFLAYSWDNLAHDFTRREFAEFLIFCLLGLFLSAMACVILWFGVLVPKFRQMTRREELVYQ